MDIALGIVGTAGRHEDGKRLTRTHFESMCVIASELIKQCKESNYEIDTLISGGAAWADFSCVKLFLDHTVPKLKLFLPAEWDGGRFYDNGQKEHNDGGISNYYHLQFQRMTGINSLSQMEIARQEGAEFIIVNRGFFARNYLIAKHSDFLLAITFGNGSEVKDGGTSHTVKCYLDRVRKEGFFDKSFHYDLNSKSIYEGCQVPPIDEDAAAKFILSRYQKSPKMVPPVLP